MSSTQSSRLFTGIPWSGYIHIRQNDRKLLSGIKRSFQVDGFLPSFLCPSFLNLLSLSFPVPLCESKNSIQTNQFSKSPDHCYNPILTFSSVQSFSPVQLFVTPWTAACQASLFITHSQSLLKLDGIIKLVIQPSNHLILCCSRLLLPSIFPSIRVFSSESVLRIRWPKHWSFSFNISPSSKYSGLVSFRIDWFDLPAVRGTLKSLLQHHSSKASILRRSAFFMVQLSHPYMTTGKTIALTRRAFVDKVMSLLFNMLSRLVIAFLPMSKRLNFMAVVTICSDFRAQENKVCHCFHCFPIYLPWSDGTGCHDLSFLNVEF